MARKLSATEKLARDICWLGFQGDPRPYGRSAKDYWENKVTPEAKKRYLEQASEYIWWTRRLTADRLRAAVEEHDAVTAGEGS